MSWLGVVVLVLVILVGFAWLLSYPEDDDEDT